jgi:hypothetical protein
LKKNGRIEVKRRQGRRSKKLQDDLQERIGYGKVKEEALDHTVWRTGFGNGCGTLIKIERGMNE